MGTLRVLTVCSGNICRSPFAAALLTAELGEAVTVTSAGTFARDGDAVTPEMLAIGFEYGVDLGAHRARYITESMVADADLILAMSRSHRREVVELAPKKIASTLTLREFGRLAAGISPGELVFDDSLDSRAKRVASLLRVVAAKKGHELQRVEPIEDDVIDPYRRDRETYVLSTAQIADAVQNVSRILTVAL